jgi:WD40 repeat protein
METIKVTYPVIQLLLLKNTNLAIADASPVISIWNTKAKLKTKIQQLIGHSLSVRDLAEINGGERLASVSSGDMNIKIWNITTGRLLKNLSGYGQRVIKLISIGNEKIVSFAKYGHVLVWNVTNGEVIDGKDLGRIILCVCIFKNGDIAIGAEWSLRILNWNTGRDILTLNMDNYYILSLVFLLNGHLASGERSSLINIWNVTVGVKVHSLRGHSSEIYALVNIKSGILASASLDGTVKIWNYYQNGTCLKTLKGHLNTILSLVFLPNDTLMSGSLDRTLKLWNVSRILSSNQIENLKYGK